MSAPLRQAAPAALSLQWPCQPAARATVAACAAPRVSSRRARDATAAAVLQFAAQPASATAAAAAAASCAGATAAAPAAPLAAPPTANSWELIYTRPDPPSSSSSSRTARRKPHPTAAPGTARSQPGADPRLVRLTQQLLAASGSEPGLRAALAGEALAPAELRRLLTYLDRCGAADVALEAFGVMKGLPQYGTGDLGRGLARCRAGQVAASCCSSPCLNCLPWPFFTASQAAAGQCAVPRRCIPPHMPLMLEPFSAVLTRACPLTHGLPVPQTIQCCAPSLSTCWRGGHVAPAPPLPCTMTCV